MRDIEQFKPGLYQHYKGGYYVALFIARHHDSGVPVVAYVCCRYGTVSVREWDQSDQDSWSDRVEPQTGYAVQGTAGVPRFRFVGPPGTEIPS